MATVLDECTTVKQLSLVRFSMGKSISAKDIHKEMRPVYDVKCLSRKAVHNSVAKVSLMMKNLKSRCGSG
jgi:hypothetical protein